MKNSNKTLIIVIVAVICVVMLILFSVLGVMFVGGAFVLGSSGSEKNTKDDSNEHSVEIYQPEDVIFDFSYEDPSESEDSSTESKPNETERPSRPEETTRTPETTHPPRPSGNTVLTAEALYVVTNTPSGRGATMMSLATSTSSSKGTLPEGTVVRVLSDDTSNRTGYVQVLAYTDPMDVHCYIKKEYLAFKGYPSHYSPPTSNTRHISYNTPAHAGVNMRTRPSSSSELVVLLTEGTPVFIAEPYSPNNNGYVKVGCEEFPSGEPLYGWVLYDYLVR